MKRTAPAATRPTKRKNTHGSPGGVWGMHFIQSDVVDLSKHLRIQMVHARAVAEEEASSLRVCFKVGQCIPQIQALTQSSEKAMDALTKPACADYTLLSQVSEVHDRLHAVLDCCVERGSSTILRDAIFETSHEYGMEMMDAYYRKSPPTFILIVVGHIKAVHRAALAAL